MIVPKAIVRRSNGSWLPCMGYGQRRGDRPFIDAVLLCNPNSPTGLPATPGWWRGWRIWRLAAGFGVSSMKPLPSIVRTRRFCHRRFPHARSCCAASRNFMGCRDFGRVCGGKEAYHRTNRGAAATVVREHAGPASGCDRTARCAACQPEPPLHESRTAAATEEA